jgi:hypothetical protein
MTQTIPSQDRSNYRRGFEAAVWLRERGKSLAEATDLIEGQYPDLCERHGFVRGYKRGLRYWGERHGAPS